MTAIDFLSFVEIIFARQIQLAHASFRNDDEAVWGRYRSSLAENTQLGKFKSS